MRKPASCSAFLLCLLALSVPGPAAEMPRRADVPLSTRQTISALWQSVGPDGGVILSLAADPTNDSVVYAGTDGGGVFRSDDGGATWRWSGGGLTEFEIESLAVDPSNPNRLFAGTLHAGFLSTDGGANWSALGGGFPSSIVNSIAIDPSSASTIYAASTDGVLVKSVDGGQNWSSIGASVSGEQPRILAIDPDQTSTIYLGTIGGGVFRSDDAGGSWTAKNDGLTGLFIDAIAVDPTHHDTVYAGGFNGGVFQSTNRGESWTVVNDGLMVSRLTALAVDGSGAVYVGASSGAFTHAAGASTWTNLQLPEGYVNALALGQGATPVVYAGTGSVPIQGGSVAAFRGGAWALSVDGIANLTVAALAVDDSAGGMIYAGTIGFGGLQVSSDGGTSWTSPSSFTNGSVTALLVAQVSGVNPPPPPLVLAGTARGVFKSVDRGATWTGSTSGFANPAIASLLATGTSGPLFAGTYGGLYTSADQAATWQRVTAGLTANIFYSLASDASTAGALYAGTEVGVFRSDDGGSSWTATAAGPVGNVYALMVVGGDVFAGSDGGLFRSSDTGASWVLVGGLPAAATHALLFDSGVLYAGTSSGAFESGDVGATWSSAGDGLTNPRVLSLAAAGGGALFAGTDGGSVFRRAVASSAGREPVFLASPPVAPRLVSPRS